MLTQRTAAKSNIAGDDGHDRSKRGLDLCLSRLRLRPDWGFTALELRHISFMANALRTDNLPARGSDAALGERPEMYKLPANETGLD
jgi:hypothetical protein